MKTYEDLPLWDGKLIPSGNQYLLKVIHGTGFAVKLTMKNELPKAFDEWNGVEDSPIYLLNELPREGWGISGYRIGKSQSWGIIRHPLRFNLEIHLDSLFGHIRNSEITRGSLSGEYAWEYGKLLDAKQYEAKLEKTKNIVPKAVVKMKDLIPGHIYQVLSNRHSPEIYIGKFFNVYTKFDSKQHLPHLRRLGGAPIVYVHGKWEYIFKSVGHHTYYEKYTSKKVYDTGRTEKIDDFLNNKFGSIASIGEYYGTLVSSSDKRLKMEDFITPGTQEYLDVKYIHKDEKHFNRMDVIWELL